MNPISQQYKYTITMYIANIYRRENKWTFVLTCGKAMLSSMIRREFLLYSVQYYKAYIEQLVKKERKQRRKGGRRERWG